MKAALAAVAALALALVAGAGAVSAATHKPPTLGGRLAVQGGSLVLEDLPAHPTIIIASSATVPVHASLAVSGTGYALATTDLGTLRPGQVVTDALLSEGPGSGTLTAELLPLGLRASTRTESVGLALTLSVRHRTPLETFMATVSGPGLAAAGLLALAMLALIAASRRRRPT